MFYYTYVLFSLKDKKFYSGFSTDLDHRMHKHNKGDTPSTKYRRPLLLIFYEAYLNKRDALRREKYFKTAKGKTTLRTMLTEYLRELEKEKNKIVEFRNKKKKLLI